MVTLLGRGIGVSVVAASLLVGCGGGGEGSPVINRTPNVPAANTSFLTASASYTANKTSAVSSVSQKITYTIPGVNGSPVSTTAAVFVPNGVAPVQGWPMIVWAHGTLGVADGCEPTANSSMSGYDELLANLVASGFMVVAPNYEGLGDSPSETHPYLNSASEARSLAYAAMAAREQVPTAGVRWIAFGHSQGGHAVIGAADTINQDSTLNQTLSAANMQLVGIAAMAPASNLGASIDLGQTIIKQLAGEIVRLKEMLILADMTPEGYAEVKKQIEAKSAQIVGLIARQMVYSSFATAGMRQTAPSLQYTDVFEDRSAAIAQTVPQYPMCTQQVANKFVDPVTGTGDIVDYIKAGNAPWTYPGLKPTATSNPTVQAFLGKTSVIGDTKINPPVLLIQGADDTTVLPQITDLLASQMKTAGNTVKPQSYSTTTLTSAQVAALAPSFKNGVTYVTLGTGANDVAEHTTIVKDASNIYGQFFQSVLNP